MYNVKTLNKIAACGTDLLDRSKYTVGDDIDNPQAILVRSASMHEMELGDDLLAIARAGAGVNNIPVDKCSEKGIVVFNTPGANANAVKELVILGLLISSRKVTAAIDWAKTLKGKGDEVGKLVEKGKSQFVGPEIKGKKLGVIGLGAIGALVANAAAELGMEVIGADPFLSVQGALNLSNKVKYVKSNKEIFETCDYITVHVPLTPETKDMINADVIKTMKKNVRIMNFARGGLVNEDAVVEALANGGMAAYVTDFPCDKILGVDGVVALPHLGASIRCIIYRTPAPVRLFIHILVLSLAPDRLVLSALVHLRLSGIRLPVPAAALIVISPVDVLPAGTSLFPAVARIIFTVKAVVFYMSAPITASAAAVLSETQVLLICLIF